MKNEIKVIKMITGEEIITKMTEGEDGDLLLESPMVVQLQGSPTAGRMALGLVPWSLAGNTKKITLKSKYVLVTLPPNPDMEQSYISATTDISLPSDNDLKFYSSLQ